MIIHKVDQGKILVGIWLLFLQYLIYVELYWIIRRINYVIEVGCKISEFELPSCTNLETILSLISLSILHGWFLFICSFIKKLKITLI